MFSIHVTLALNYENIVNNPNRILKSKSLINNYNWKKINFPSHVKVWIKRSRRNRARVYLKHNFKRENKLILLMIADVKNDNI